MGVSGMIGTALPSFFFLTFLAFAGTTEAFFRFRARFRLLDLRPVRLRPLFRLLRRVEDFLRDFRGLAAGVAGLAGRIIRIAPPDRASEASSPMGPPPPGT